MCWTTRLTNCININMAQSWESMALLQKKCLSWPHLEAGEACHRLGRGRSRSKPSRRRRRSRGGRRQSLPRRRGPCLIGLWLCAIQLVCFRIWVYIANSNSQPWHGHDIMVSMTPTAIQLLHAGSHRGWGLGSARSMKRRKYLDNTLSARRHRLTARMQNIGA